MRNLILSLLASAVAANTSNDLCNTVAVAASSCDWACHESALTNYRSLITRYEGNIATINQCVATGITEFNRLWLLENAGQTTPPAWSDSLPKAADLAIPAKETQKRAEYTAALASITALNARLPIA